VTNLAEPPIRLAGAARRGGPSEQAAHPRGASWPGQGLARAWLYPKLKHYITRRNERKLLIAKSPNEITGPIARSDPSPARSGSQTRYALPPPGTDQTQTTLTKYLNQ